MNCVLASAIKLYHLKASLMMFVSMRKLLNDSVLKITIESLKTDNSDHK